MHQEKAGKEDKMTNREKIEELRKVQDYKEEIADRLETIISNTSDSSCQCVCDFRIDGNEIYVRYQWEQCGDYGHSAEIIPIEWLDEGFDYKAAYTESRRKLENET